MTEPATVWTDVLADLERQMARPTFDTWLRDTTIASVQEDAWTMRAHSPYAVDWLENRLKTTILRALRHHAGPEATITFTTNHTTPTDEATTPDEATADPTPAKEPPAPSPTSPSPTSSALPLDLLTFDPNTARTGGFAMVGHYANRFWAALLGPVAWRLYQIAFADDKGRSQDLWTLRRTYSISHLARLVAGGRGRRPNRNQIRGRWRKNYTTDERIWSPGAFDVLTEHNVARISWHDGSLRWRPWTLGGFERKGRSGLRVVYGMSVVTRLPLLTPRQAALLPAELQTGADGHEAHLVQRGVDSLLWERIRLPSLAGLDETVITVSQGTVTGAQDTVTDSRTPFFRVETGT